MDEARPLRGLLAREWSWLVGLYLLSVAMRWPLRDAVYYYGDEPGHYLLAQKFLALPTQFEDLYGRFEEYYAGYIVIRRPFYHVLMAPAAAISFEAFRVWHILLASFLPLMATVALRQAGAPRLVSYSAGLLVALHPRFVVWGAIVLMEELAAIAVAWMVVAYNAGRPLQAALVGVAAVWTKEVAYLSLLVLLGWSLRDQLRMPLREIRLNPGHLALVSAAAVAPIPGILFLARSSDIWPTRVPNVPEFFDPLLLSAWLLPFVVLGLAWAPSRLWSILCLSLLAFLVLLNGATRWMIPEWYFAYTAFFTVVAAALSVGVGWQVLRPRPRARGALVAGALAAAFLIIVPMAVAVPPAAARWVSPVSDRPEPSLQQMYDYHLNRDEEFREASAWIPHDSNVLVLWVDVEFGRVLAENRGEHALLGWSAFVEQYQQRLDPWAPAVEARAELTFVEKHTYPLNVALREVYSDCIVRENARFVLIEGNPCIGRAEALQHAYFEARNG